jgi:hypothetical protein
MRRLLRRRSLLVLFLLLFVPAAGGWTWPVQGPVLQTFSFDSAHPYAADQHRGIAIGAGDGASVRAPASGIVSFAGTVPTNGKTLTIQTPSGLAVSLTHLGSIEVARNVSVDEGAVVGTVGPSGTPEFDVPYVHLGIREAANDQGYLDPLAFLPVLAPPAAVPEPAQPADVPAPAPTLASPQPVEAPAVPAVPPAPVVEAPAVPVVPATPVVEAPAVPSAVATTVVEAPPASPSVVDPVPDTFVIAAPAHETPATATGLEFIRPLAASPTLGAGAASVPALGRGVMRTRSRALAPLAAQPLAIWSPAIGTDAGDLRSGTSAVQQASASSPRSRAVTVPKDGAWGLGIGLLALAAAVATLLAVRMISSPSAHTEGARPGREDSRRAGLALRQWSAPHRARSRIRRARGRLREVSPLEGQRRPHGERDGRARHTRDGVRRQDWGVAA